MTASTRQIRPARPSDLLAMSALIQRTVAISNGPDYAASEIEQTIASFAPEQLEARLRGRQVFVAVEHDRLVGVVSFAEATGRLHSLFVEPSLQRGGVGRALVDHVERTATEAAISEIVLSSSITAVGFYEELGYERVEFECHGGGSTYRMRKRLPDTGSDDAGSYAHQPDRLLRVN